MAQARLPKVAIGFVVRRCVLALGRQPTPREFAEWANTAGENGGALIGRPISESDAEVILRHQGRPVSARSARPFEVVDEQGGALRPPASGDVRDRVVDFQAVRARQRRR